MRDLRGMGYTDPMNVRAVVHDGRLVLDEPTELPEGTVLDLVVDDEGDDLTDAEREDLHRRLDASWLDAQAGHVRPVQAILDELHTRR